MLIIAAAILWATDALFRVPSLERLDPLQIVLIEHLLATLAFLPWMLLRRRTELFSLKPSQWLGVAFIGIAGSALATVLFTASFRYVNPSVAILLQKLQPLLVIVLARAFLGEKPGSGFWPWASAALIAAVLLSVPSLSGGWHAPLDDLGSRGAVYALSAAAIWAIATVIGRSLAANLPTEVTTFWRYAFGLGALFALLSLAGSDHDISAAFRPDTAHALLYMALGPGLLAMLLYYAGLKHTSATGATLLELLFPVAAIGLNAVFLGATLTPLQTGAGTILLIAATRASLLSS